MVTIHPRGGKARISALGAVQHGSAVTIVSAAGSFPAGRTRRHAAPRRPAPASRFMPQPRQFRPRDPAITVHDLFGIFQPDRIAARQAGAKDHVDLVKAAVGIVELIDQDRRADLDVNPVSSRTSRIRFSGSDWPVSTRRRAVHRSRSRPRIGIDHQQPLFPKDRRADAPVAGGQLHPVIRLTCPILRPGRGATCRIDGAVCSGFAAVQGRGPHPSPIRFFPSPHRHSACHRPAAARPPRGYAVRTDRRRNRPGSNGRNYARAGRSHSRSARQA